MNYKHKNLNFNVTINNHSDLLGDTTVYIPIKHRHFFMNDCHMNPTNNGLKSGNTIYEGDHGSIYFDIDEKEFVTYDPDIAIIYYEWLLDLNEEIYIDVCVSNIYWLIHDLLHSENDAHGCTVYVDSYIESERLIDTFKIMDEKNIYYDYELINTIEESFYERFNESINLDEFKEKFLEEYY